jgi:hypothetical protein
LHARSDRSFEPVLDDRLPKRRAVIDPREASDASPKSSVPSGLVPPALREQHRASAEPVAALDGAIPLSL